MARITASVYTSHIPAIGAALDLGKTQEPYWQPVFKGYEVSKTWMQHNKPDVIFLVYNDHATAFDLDFIPTFAIGTAASGAGKILYKGALSASLAISSGIQPQFGAGDLDGTED